MGFDNIRQFFPNRKILKEEFSKFQIPLWNPYIYSGTPFMGAFDTAVWYPLSFVASLLPAIDGWNLLVVIQPVLSLLFMYLFLRSLKFDVHISAFGAFAYALSGWMIVYWQEILVLEHSFIWVPLALYASNRLWEYQKDKLGFFLLIFSLACSVFAGFLQMSIYVYICVVLWNAYRYISFGHTNQRSKRILYIISGIVISLCVVAIQCIPSLEAFLLSPRGTDTAAFVFSNNLLPFQHLITLFAPDFWGNTATYSYFGGNGFYFEKMIFIGIIPLLFAVYGATQIRQHSIWFWILLAITCLSLGFALPTSWLPYYLRIPVLSNSYPTRIFGVWALSATVLACYGLQSFVQKPHWKRMICILVGLTVGLAIGWIAVASMWCVVHSYPRNIFVCQEKISVIRELFNTPAVRKNALLYTTTSLRNLLIPTCILFFGWITIGTFKFSKTIGLLFVYGLTIFSGIIFAGKYVYFAEQRFVYPELPVIGKLRELSSSYDRVWGYGYAFIEKNIPQYYRWFSTDGYGNLSSLRYAELLSTIVNNGKLGGAIRRSDTDIYEASEWDPFSTANPYRLRMMSMLGVKYVLESKKGELKDKIPTEKRFSEDVFTLIWQDPAWRIWEYKQTLPRAIFADSYIVKSNNQEILDALYDPKTDLSRTVILESEPKEKITLPQKSTTTSKATISNYSMNSITISSDSDVDGFVVVMDNYYPGWHANVDGKNTSIYRANYAFKAVYVPKGQHQVVLNYFPLSFLLGVVVTCIGVVLFLFCIVVVIK
jgi:uncharacterized membrane protein YfhO